MLRPAALYLDELQRKFAEKLYTEDYFYYNGVDRGSALPNIDSRDDAYRFAITDKENNVVGYFTYTIDPHTDTCGNFGLMAFSHEEPFLMSAVLTHMEMLVKIHRRIEWAVVDGNPVQEIYNRFCFRHMGFMHIYHDAVKDLEGKFQDYIVYEIVKGKKGRMR